MTEAASHTDASPGPRYTVAFEGFSSFERAALASSFRLAARRSPAYVQVEHADLADFLVADADHHQVVGMVATTGRLRDTVFVGSHTPEGAGAWLARPIDPPRIVRELDVLAAQRHAGFAASIEPARANEIDLLLGDPPAPAVADNTASLGHGNGRDVLVVEDSGVARKFLSLRLRRLGYTVHLALTGEQALAMLERHAFAIVFVDIVLGPPDSVDGLRVCQYLKQRAQHPGGFAPRVVIVTGLAGSTDRVRGSLAGCDAYLTKPVGEPEFVAVLRDLDPEFAAA